MSSISDIARMGKATNVIKAYVNIVSKFIGLQLIGLLAFSSFIQAQQKAARYSIVNRGDTIGQMQVTQRVSDENVFYSASSTVSIRVIMNITVNIEEESHFINGKLNSSKSKRLVNGRSKQLKETKTFGDYYLLTDGNRQSKLQEKQISFDFLMFYFTEPVNKREIYSHYHQRNLTVLQRDKHIYEVDLPEGGSNIYYYKNGKCCKVDLHSTLFNAQMILSNYN